MAERRCDRRAPERQAVHRAGASQGHDAAQSRRAPHREEADVRSGRQGPRRQSASDRRVSAHTARPPDAGGAVYFAMISGSMISVAGNERGMKPYLASVSISGWMPLA